MGRSVFVSCFVKTARVQLRHSRIGFVRAEGERIPIHLNCPTHRRRSSSVVRHSSSQVATVLSPLLAVLILYLVQLSLYKTTHLDRYKCVVVAGESPRLDPRLSAHPAAHSLVLSLVRSLTRSFVRSARDRCGCECVRYEEVDTYQARERLEGIGSGPPRCVEYDETTCGRCLDDRGVAWLVGWFRWLRSRRELAPPPRPPTTHSRNPPLAHSST